MGQEKSIGEIDIASILNMTVEPVNEAVIDSKKGKDNKPQKTEITIKGGKDIAKAAKESGKQINNIQKAIGKVTKAPVKFVPDTSEVDKAKKKIEKSTESKVKLKTEKVDLPLLGKTPMNVEIGKDSQKAIKESLSAAEKASKNLIKAASEAVKKIGSASYLEELNDRERRAISTAVSNVKKNNPGISEDKLKTFEQNLILDRRAKKTHETLSENFKLPGSSSKAYGQEMYEAAIAAAKIQAAVKIREGLHSDEGYTQFLSKNDRSKSFNGNTLKIPGKFIDQIQTGLYEHFGVNKLGTALASDKNWTGIQDRMSRSVESFSTGLAAVIDASIPKTSLGGRITKKFQQRVDSAVEMAIDMSVDDAIGYLTGKKGVKENKEALSLLGKKKDGEYEYSVDDILDILEKKSRIGKEGNDQGTNYKGFSQLLAALQVYNRNGASGLSASYAERLSELVDIITSTYMGNDGIVDYDAQTIIKSINAALDKVQDESKKADQTTNEQPKIEKKSKPKKSNKKSSSTTSKKESAKTETKTVEEKEPGKIEKSKEKSVSSTPNKSHRKVVKPPKILKGNSQVRDVNGDLLSWNGQEWKIKSNSESDSLWENIPENPSPEFLKRFERAKKFTKNHPELFGPDALPIGFDEEDFWKTMNDGVSVKVPDASKDIKDGAKQIKQASDAIEKTSKTDQKISDDKKESSDSIKPKTHSSSHSKEGNNQQDDQQDETNAGNDAKKTKKEFTSQYKEAISDVRDLGKAYVSLQNAILNPTGKTYKKSNGKVGSSYEDFIDQQLSDIEKKENRVRSFNKNVHNQNKTNPSQIKDQNIFDSYEKELQDSQLQQSQFDDNLVSLMRSAYEVRNNAQNEILKTIGSPTRKGEINLEKLAKQQERFAKSDYAYNLLSDKVSKRKGNAYQESAISDITESSKTDRESILQNNFGTLSKQINDYVSSIERAGRASEQFKSDFGKIQSDLNKNDPSQFKDTESGMKEYLDFMTDIRSRFNSNKDFYENGIGKSTLDYEAIKNKLIKAENYNTKTNEYKSKVSGFQEQWDGIIDSYNSGDIEKMKEAEHAATSLISTMNDFYKESSKSDKYKKTTSKGTLVEDTVGKVQDINDAKQSLKELTDHMKLTNKVSETIDTSTGKITQKFKDDYSGNIITVTSNIDKLNNALRTTQKIQSSGSGGSGGSLLGGLKNLVSGNFKSIVGEIGSSVANVQILGQAFQQMKDGFNTFLDFNKGLTNISYTMDMSKEQLSSLGSSAVDMAKDLSMSLDNTMDIYQIYANMNTTPKEIQETAKPTAILSNLSGVDASTAADQVQGILQQFHMLEDGSTTAADASMHVVDVLDKISGNIGMDYAKGIKVISDAVQASGQVAFDAGMSYEQLAAVSAKVAERTREDGSSIGNAMKTIITRISKVGSMPEYAADVSNEDLSQASESLHKVGVEVYNTDGSFRDLDTILSELNSKWDGLTDAQKANISYNVAATRQTSKFKNILEAWTDSMNLANEATTTSGNAEANQEKYMKSFSGKIQAIKTQMDEFWLNFYNSDQVSGALDFVQGLTEGFTGLEEAIGPIPTLITAVFSALTVKNAATKGLEFLVGKDGQASGLANAVG